MASAKTLGIVLFDGFELLDVFGPAEAYASRETEGAFTLLMVAQERGAVASAQGPKALAEFSFADCPRLDIMLAPGGIGTRREVENPALLSWLRVRASEAETVTSVCTGAALLARAGVLDGHRATTNKRSFDWVVSQGPKVNWVAAARWVEDGKFATSSGVSAGIDMALAIIARQCGAETAEKVAIAMEYEWHRDPSWDPFAKIWQRV
ncbi:MAG TPA: DJ-1/PfpI family protein [Candidatus Binataceae bacterium]|nr:DJ-1/PfpI family protein [Candidatus Binataceae bacterium]